MESFKDYKILSRRDNSTALLGTLNGLQSIVVVQNKEVDLKEIPKMKMEKYTVITDNPPYRSMESANYYLRVTSPCTQQHIKKYDRPEYRSETYDEYLEYLQKDKLSTNWIQKIRDGECEQPIYHDDRFIIINDYKWDMSDVSQLYLLLIFKDHDLFTIRELSLALCKEAKIMILQILSTRYGLEEKDVLIYFHYKPSYYVLHVHVVNLERRMEPGMMVGRAILLDDIVENLMIDPLYYKKRKLFYVGS